MTIFKIRNSQGLFSTGGSHPKWTKRGKTWVALNHLNAHLTLIRTELNNYTRVNRQANPYVNCEVVEYTVIEDGSRSIVL